MPKREPGIKFDPEMDESGIKLDPEIAGLDNISRRGSEDGLPDCLYNWLHPSKAPNPYNDENDPLGTNRTQCWDEYFEQRMVDCQGVYDWGLKNAEAERRDELEEFMRKQELKKKADEERWVKWRERCRRKEQQMTRRGKKNLRESIREKSDIATAIGAHQSQHTLISPSDPASETPSSNRDLQPRLKTEDPLLNLNPDDETTSAKAANHDLGNNLQDSNVSNSDIFKTEPPVGNEVLVEDIPQRQAAIKHERQERDLRNSPQSTSNASTKRRRTSTSPTPPTEPRRKIRSRNNHVMQNPSPAVIVASIESISIFNSMNDNHFIYIPSTAVPVRLDYWDNWVGLCSDFSVEGVRLDDSNRSGWFLCFGNSGNGKKSARECFEHLKGKTFRRIYAIALKLCEKGLIEIDSA